MKPTKTLFFLSRAMRRAAFFVAAIITLVALFYVVENWRGRRAWEKYKAELIARGERLGLSDYAVAQFPAEQNFAETPVLKAIAYKAKTDTNVWAKFKAVRGVFSYYPAGADEITKENAEEILEAFKGIEPELAELHAAARRPYARFTNNHANAFLADVPNFVVLRTLAQLFAVHASAELVRGQPDQAFADLEVIHRLADSLDGQSTLVEAMIRQAILGLALYPFEQGLSMGAWSDSKLAAFQKYFESVDLLTGFDAAMRGGERNGVTHLVEDLPRRELVETMTRSDSQSVRDYVFKVAVRWCPRGWLYQNAVNYSRVMQMSFDAYDVRAQRVFPQKCDAALAFLDEELRVTTPFKYLAAVGVPNIAKATQVTARQLTYLREAALACALDRYRRAHGEYPEALAGLVPRFVATLPQDTMTGDGLKYERPDKSHFRLYSVGWDLTDDGGTQTADRMVGDWVWPPAK